MRKVHFLIVAAMGISMFIGLLGCGKNDGVKKLTGTGKTVVTGCDWGPAVTKVILSVPGELDRSQDLSNDMFRVQETRKPSGSKKTVNRTVTDIYFSDENGETEADENSWVIAAPGHDYVAVVTEPTCGMVG